jgi:hypothetical protein
MVLMNKVARTTSTVASAEQHVHTRRNSLLLPSRRRRAHCSSAADRRLHEFSDSFRYRLPLRRYNSACDGREEDVMHRKQMPDGPRAGSGNVVTDGESVLRQQNAALREDNEDLRASALWWKTLYEQAQRRCADLDPLPFSEVAPEEPTKSARHPDNGNVGQFVDNSSPVRFGSFQFRY